MSKSNEEYASVLFCFTCTNCFLVSFRLFWCSYSTSVVTPFTIEQQQSSTNNKHEKSDDRRRRSSTTVSSSTCLSSSRRIEGLMTTYGYALSNPDHSNRISIWFTGGTIEVIPSNNDDEEAWHGIFDKSNLPKRRLQELGELFC